jgi:ATP-dependent helicase HrpB
MAALAYPDRIGARRPGSEPRFLLSGGRGARLDASDALGAAPFIVATDLDGKGRDARIRRGIQISEKSIRALFADRINWHEAVQWSRRDRRIQATRQERFGALVLAETPLKDIAPGRLATAAIDGIRALGIPKTAKAQDLLQRAAWLARTDLTLPDLSDETLLAGLEDWLMPFLMPPPRTAEQIAGFDITPALQNLLGPDALRKLETQVPTLVHVPTGRKVAIDYSGEAPEISIRLQELFGLDRHPLVAGEPLRITMVSPAGRPVQTTTDLPGFWRTTYKDVRKDMRGRYPKHPWPENPLDAVPTTRAKPRKS